MRKDTPFVELETTIRINPVTLDGDDLKELQRHLSEFPTKPDDWGCYNFGMMEEIEIGLTWTFWDESETGERLDVWSYDQNGAVFNPRLDLYPEDVEAYDFVAWCEEMQNCYDEETIFIFKEVSCNMSHPLWQSVVDAHKDAWDDPVSLELEIKDYFERHEICYDTESHYCDPYNFCDAIAQTIDIFETLNCEPKPFNDTLNSFLNEGEEN